ncbi:hypothetical protein [Arcticibacter eurypsychrophilus]|uniref:hypothetical protein n=1 Tax=Arcticibacter eurypsychrophilus TaxID=1434752 RepID=UPI00084D9EDE|nr:hypothetical protein [Arcticibacter eurypsychrophilus]
MSLKKFLTQFGILVLILAVAALLLDSANSILVPKFWIIFGFLAGLTLLAYITSSIAIKTGGELSVYILLAAIFIKLIVSLFFVVFYLRIYKVNSTFFALEFFSIYFLFTAFEVKSLLVNLRAPK